jgi:Protein of unknown function (DUF1036)
MKIGPITCISIGLVASALMVSIASQESGRIVRPALAQPGKTPPTFELYACNKSESAEVFLALVTISGKQLQAKGWSTLPRSNCEKYADAVRIGVFGRPSFWWYASAGDSYWSNDRVPKVQICANLNEHFEYSWDGKARDCKTGEQPVTFYEYKVDDKERTVPLLLE